MKLKILLILILIIVVIGCSQKPTEFPAESDFLIDSVISDLNPKVGQDVEIYIEFKNNSGITFEVTRGPELISVQYRSIEDPIDFISTGPGYSDTINTKLVKNKKSLQFEKPGKYKINVIASFSIIIKNEGKNYRIKAKQIIIDVS